MFGITCLLGALLAVSFPFKGTIRDNAGAPIPGLTRQKIDLRLYASVDSADPLWGRRFEVSVQPNGLYAVEVGDDTGEKIPSGTGITTPDRPLSEVLVAVGSDPLYVGVAPVSAIYSEMRPRSRLMPASAALFADDADEASELFELERPLVLGKEAIVSSNYYVMGVLTAKQANGTDKLHVGGEAMAENVIVGNEGVTAVRAVTAGSLTAESAAAGSLTTPAAEISEVSADTVEFSTCSGVGNATPKGMIVLWYGNPQTELPRDWALCNGQTVNGVQTPDLRNRFAVGARRDKGETGGSGYAVADVGGAESVKLTESQLPRHKHGFTGYQNGYKAYDVKDGNEVFTFNTSFKSADEWTTYKGGGQAHNNLPPYCGLYYLMKVR